MWQAGRPRFQKGAPMACPCGLGRCVGQHVAPLRGDVADDSALGSVVYDDSLAGVADGFEDGGQVTGVGGGEAGDGPDVVEQGEVVDDEDVGLGDDVGRQGGRGRGRPG